MSSGSVSRGVGVGSDDYSRSGNEQWPGPSVCRDTAVTTTRMHPRRPVPREFLQRDRTAASTSGTCWGRAGPCTPQRSWPADRPVRSERLVAPANQWSEQRRVAGSLFHRTNRSGVLAQRVDVQCHRRRGGDPASMRRPDIRARRDCQARRRMPQVVHPQTGRPSSFFARSNTRERKPVGQFPADRAATAPANSGRYSNAATSTGLGFRDLGHSEGGLLWPRI